MHKVGSIRKASDRILRSVMNLVPDVATDGELLKISTKAIKDLPRAITKIDGVSVRSRGGPKLTSKCCVSLSWMVMQEEHTGVYPGSGQRMPYVQRGERVLYFLAPGCLCRGYKLAREGDEPKSQREKKEYKDDCLRC
jgi:hypothetical protein